MAFFVRLTLLLTAAFLALAVAAFVLKLVFIAAAIAAIVAVGLFTVHFVRGFGRRARAGAGVRVLRGR